MLPEGSYTYNCDSCKLIVTPIQRKISVRMAEDYLPLENAIKGTLNSEDMCPKCEQECNVSTTWNKAPYFLVLFGNFSSFTPEQLISQTVSMSGQRYKVISFDLFRDNHYMAQTSINSNWYWCNDTQIANTIYQSRSSSKLIVLAKI